jgi:hypothetical protein
LLEVLMRDQPIEGVEVIALSEHVTYWDHQGWKDPFDSQQFTARQQQYGLRFNLDSIYTPQLVIDGAREAIGSDKRAIEKALKDAAKSPKPELRVRIDSAAASRIEVGAEGAGFAIEKNAELLFALTESNLSVDVKRGENANRTLRHSGVVRVLQSAGNADVTSKRVTFSLAPDWKRENLRVVAFLQSRKDRRILAVGATQIATP